MSFWPDDTDYKKAIRNLKKYFIPEIIAEGVIENFSYKAEPYWVQGGLSYVAKLRDKNGRLWAIKLFNEKNVQGDRISNLEKRYNLLSKYVRDNNNPYFVESYYFKSGVRIDGEVFPVLLIEWVEGITLDNAVKDAAKGCKRDLLNSIGHSLVKMHSSLVSKGIVHNDIHYENIVIRQDGSYVLVDYDDVWIDGVIEFSDKSRGHRNFQHPLRDSGGSLGVATDNFAFCVTIASIFIIIEHMGSWSKAFEKGWIDNTILFKYSDFLNPQNSPLICELAQVDSYEVQCWLAVILNNLLDVKRLELIPAAKDIFIKQAVYKDPNYKFDRLPLYNPRTRKFLKKNLITT